MSVSPYMNTTPIIAPYLSPLFGLGFWPSLASPRSPGDDLNHSHYVPYEGSLAEDLMGLGISYNSINSFSFKPTSTSSGTLSHHKHQLSWSRHSHVFMECEVEKEPQDSKRNGLRCHSRAASITKNELLFRHTVSSDGEDVLSFRESSSSMQIEQRFDVKQDVQEHITRLPGIPLWVATEHVEPSSQSFPPHAMVPSMTVYQQDFGFKYALSPELSNDTNEMPLPVVDVNMRQISVTRQVQSLGVNPASLSSSESVNPTATIHEDIQTTPSTLATPEIVETLTPEIIVKPEDVYAEEPLLPDPVTPERLAFGLLASPVKETHLPRRTRKRVNYEEETSEYEGLKDDTTSSPDFSPCERIVRRKFSSRKSVLYLEEHQESAQANSSVLSSTQTERSITNAYHGISLNDLQFRAERYRLKNPGREYTKEWLLSFTGRLSNSGKPLDKYRCYVIGCHQTNKRRDHILIHVGGHLNQRPFKCSHCPSRFLRKNERNRHELGHTGIRPFVCHSCPPNHSTFVRHDLLLRHMRRKHKSEVRETKREPRTTKKARIV